MKKGRKSHVNLSKHGIKGIILTMLLVIGVGGMVESVAATSEMETPAGIDFYRSDESTSPSTSDSKTEPSVPANPTIKPSGRLPMTGELLQPILFLIIGWLLFILAMCLYLAYKRRKKGEE